MSKPINIEAQRVVKILDDVVQKLEVVSYLSADLFSNILTQDYDLEDVFGRELADLLLYHAQLEKSFKENVLDDDQMTEEHRGVHEKMRKTTSKLVRILIKDEDALLKLRRFDDHKNTDMTDFLN